MSAEFIKTSPNTSFRLPNFYVIGAQKSGTTSLHHYLAAHPDIYLPEKKETKFFVMDDRYARGFGSYLQENFSTADNEKLMGEVDPDYMYFECALDRMVEHLDMSTLKFVVVLRNPAERAFSHYLMTYRRGLESLSFEDAIDHEAERLTRTSSEQAYFYSKMHFSYIDRGYYYRQISRLLNYIDKGQLHLILSDELKSDPKKCLIGLYEFLGVNSDVNFEGVGGQYHSATVPRSIGLINWLNNKQSATKNILKTLLPSPTLRTTLRNFLLDANQSNTGIPTLNEGTRQKLLALYRDDIEQLAQLTGLTLDVQIEDKRSG